MISVENLVVRRGRRPVLNGIDLAINSGECVIIVGPNGAGKTTLLQSILGLLPDVTGQVRIHDKPISRWTRRALARQVVYVPQEHDGFLGFLVRDVVSASRYAYVSALGRAGPEDTDAVERAITDCGIDHLVDRALDTLSSGERQKVWIAAAVAQGSPALLLDEPTTALDPRHEADLVRLMRRLLKTGRTLIVVSHDLNLAAWLGGRVVALREGHKVFDGSAAEFLRPERLQEVFQTEFDLPSVPDRQLPAVQLRIR